MADKRVFLTELDSHADSLRRAFEQMGQTIQDNGRDLDALRKTRSKRIGEYIDEILPDLSPASITQLNAKLPGAATTEQVVSLIAGMKQTYQGQVDRLLTTYDPKSYEGTKMGLEVKLQEAERDLDYVKAPLDGLKAIPDLSRLMQSGYGTDAYPHGFLNSQYYRDWKAADAAVERAGNVRNWVELAARYRTAAGNVITVGARVASVRKQIETLTSLHDEYENAKAALDQVPQKARETISVKVRSKLDALDPMPDWASDIANLDKKIAAKVDETSKLQETQGKMSEQIASMQKIKAQATRSRDNQVPDKYLQAIRQTRPFGASGGSSHTVYVNDNSWLLPMILYTEMGNHFSSDRAYRDGREDQRQADYAYAHADRSGNS